MGLADTIKKLPLRRLIEISVLMALVELWKQLWLNGRWLALTFS